MAQCIPGPSVPVCLLISLLEKALCHSTEDSEGGSKCGTFSLLICGDFTGDRNLPSSPTEAPF